MKIPHILRIPQQLKWLALWLVSGICMAGLHAQEMSPQASVVVKFLHISGLKQLDKTARKSLVSPNFYRQLGSDAAKADVNMYVPDSFHIEYDSVRTVSAFIWGPYRGWAHRLVFAMEQVEGVWFIRPSDEAKLSNSGLFDPWIRVDKNIDKKLLPPKPPQ